MAAVGLMGALSILWSIGKHTLSIPVIHRGIENWLDGKNTWLDKILWHGIIEGAGGVTSPVEREQKVLEVAAKVQTVYNEVKATEKANAAPLLPEAVKEIVLAHGLDMPWME